MNKIGETNLEIFMRGFSSFVSNVALLGSMSNPVTEPFFQIIFKATVPIDKDENINCKEEIDAGLPADLCKNTVDIII